MKHVVWEIDLDAETPREAAEKAFRIMQRPGTSATVFDVTDAAGDTCRVDLMEEEENGFTSPNQEAKRAPVPAGLCGT